MAHDIIQKPQVLSRQEVLIKLWEAREQLEREALDADTTSASEEQRSKSSNAEVETQVQAQANASQQEPEAGTQTKEPAQRTTPQSQEDTSPDVQPMPPQQETHEEVKKAVSEDARAKTGSESTAPQGGEETSSKEGTPDLMGPEVTAGLKRLLNEWPYFQKSGVLGFGPGGMEHPMYKRIADIPLRNVLNGRWEDSDQELIEEVREYVGGWRREQKVEPKEDDTFEMYLRRVIATILEKRSDIEARTQKR